MNSYGYFLLHSGMWRFEVSYLELELSRSLQLKSDPADGVAALPVCDFILVADTYP